MSDKSCANCIHGKMCLLRRAMAKANQETNYIIIVNNLAQLCEEFKHLEENKE